MMRRVAQTAARRCGGAGAPAARWASGQDNYDPLAVSDTDESLETLKSMAGKKVTINTDPFAPPGAEQKMQTVTIPHAAFTNYEKDDTQARKDPADPINWDTDAVVAWVEEHYNDPDVPTVDTDLLEAFRMGGITGKDLVNAVPNNLFKEMRKRHIKGEEYTPKVTEILVRETLLLCYKYGGQDSMW
eukprot:TRINITY_DN894_c0_g3_i1.p2 TRINITY_DN894_c0_g3~~TRINITY_DN894_c0_g3_i1.p2  ORF type:complete len:187 (+),score=70.14 TRINITY_DN894_c0_g3_i1:45-605(+)